jgi:hypothetical protein
MLESNLVVCSHLLHLARGRLPDYNVHLTLAIIISGH